MARFLGPLLALAFAAQAGFAQSQVWKVGPGGDFADLPAAFSAANDGDVLLVQTTSDIASFAPTLNGKGLTIVLDGSSGLGLLQSPLTISNLAANQRVVLRNLRMKSSSGGLGLSLQNCAGAVWIVDCEIEGAFGNEAMSATGCARVVLNRCIVEGSSFGTSPSSFVSRPGMILSNSNVQLFDCTVTGALGIPSGIPTVPSTDGQPAVRMTGGNLFTGGSTLIGGTGGPGTTFLGFCLDAKPGGDAIYLESAPAASVRILDTSLQPGAAGTTPAGCTPAPGLAGQFFDGPGLATATVSLLPGIARGFLAAPTAYETLPTTFHFNAPPGEFAFFALSGAPEISPPFTLSMDLLVTEPWILFFAGVVPPSGLLDATLTSGTMKPSVQALRLYLQGFTIALPSYEVFLCPPSDHTLLDISISPATPIPGVTPIPGLAVIQPGTFQMGSNAPGGLPYFGDPGEQPVHQVTISYPLWMGRYEVTQGEYQTLMGVNPSSFQGANNPVESVGWFNAQAYCAALTAQQAALGKVPTGYQYRLPTEAEWEYACRAGTTTEFNVGSALFCNQARFFYSHHSDSSCNSNSTLNVGSYPANAWGLHDMYGNVWEWCLDSYAAYPPGAVSDPFVTGGPDRLIRGGGWSSPSYSCRSANRNYLSPGSTGDNNIGFRVVLAPVLVP